MPFLTHDGLSLAYDEAGAGDPPMLFVHGWCCDRTHFAPQMEHFASRHRVVAVDLRGHGESARPDDGQYTLDIFADDLAWICGELGLRKPVVVGHSMGGAVTLNLAARHPQLPAAIVMLDAPVFLPGDAVDAARALVDAFRSTACHDVLRQFFDQRLFIDTDDAQRKQRILGEIDGTRPHVVASSFESILDFDAEAAAGACRAPALYVGADRALTDVKRFRGLCPQLMVGQTVGAGHFHQLEVPDQVNAMIERFLAVSLAPATTRP